MTMRPQGSHLPCFKAPSDLENIKDRPGTPLSRASGVKDGDDTSQSIYWTPCGPSPHLHLSLDFSLTNWDFECIKFSPCDDLSIQNTRADAQTRNSNRSRIQASHRGDTPLQADGLIYDSLCAPTFPRCRIKLPSGNSPPPVHSGADFPATPECQQDTFISSRSGSTFRLNTTTPSSVQPFPSTASIIRFFRGRDDERLPSEPKRVFFEPVNWDQALEDSGLDITLGDSPESWGDRKYDGLRAPARTPSF